MASLAAQIQRLGKHSVIYGLGGLTQRIVAVLLLPLYTRHLDPADYGAIEVLVALSAVVFALLRAGIQSSFFRFYFQAEDDRGRQTVVRTSFWFTMGAATIALAAGVALAGPISQVIFGSTANADLVRAAFVGLWASMNYDQLTALFRVEERSVSFSIASLANVLVTVGATVLLVVVLEKGPIGVLVGNFSGTLAVYAVLLVYRRTQLGLEFDRDVFRRMTAWGMPFVPSVIALNLIDFSDRFFLVRIKNEHELGLYAIGMRISAGLLFLLAAFRTAWPAFAYSIPEEEARRTYGYVLTYVTFFSSWAAVALGLTSPWIIHLLTTPAFYGGAHVVPVLVFAFVVFGMYVVVVTSIGRAGRRGSNWMITGAAALFNVGLNLTLIPAWGMTGAATIALAAGVALAGPISQVIFGSTANA
ncbi:MAG TPA: oligosaccharide flippase family protein, partial [Gaiellaceae bacterium]|nr:oligosaccharide flippase family protein [Gaiellaceae bacterium]